MIINFGYVAMSALLQNCSPSKTITVKNLSKVEAADARLFRLNDLAKNNLQNTRRLFLHNTAYDIKVFRLTSKLIPLATHPISCNWNWPKELAADLKSIGDYAKTHNFRISAHPDHFTLLNSPKETVIEAALLDLEYHNQIFLSMGLDSSAKLVLHVGGCYKSKDESIDRFINNFKKLPSPIKNRIILENDDKVYTVKDVLKICQSQKIPMVLDIHHHYCNNIDDDIADYLSAVFETWVNESSPPKIHLSSPKDPKSIRSHADNINLTFFVEFLKKAKRLNSDFDVMIEAKNKDAALLKLLKELKEVPGVSFINQTTIEY
ncbi:MAG: UV DNA damage repair endonuclease UvsE [Syntrophomonadaceae bacterium]|nr:UV DNA damage repair endonuclease UvsE [Syntrophomonadaceae bacterium]